MKNINKVLTGIDWKLLQEQKEKFLEIISERNDVTKNQEEGTKAMDGILSIIDAIQDAVVADGIKTEGEVFNLSEDKEEVEAETNAPIEQLCDSTVQGLTAIDLIPGKKYKCVYLPANSPWLNEYTYLNGVVFVNLCKLNCNLYCPQFESKKTDNLIIIDHDSKWEEVSEYPTELNILDQAAQQQAAINTIVLIPRIAEHGGYPGNVIKLDIGTNCLVCGKSRKIIKSWVGLSYDGSRRLSVDCWENECGCAETYQLCREKGLPVPFNTLTINEEPKEVNILGHIDTNLPKSFIHPELQSDWRTGFDKSSKFLTAVEQTSSSPENFRLSITDRNLEITYIYNYDDEKAANVDLTIFDTIMGKSIVEI